MEATDFHGILLPGGWMPDKLRRDEKVLALVRDFAARGQLVAAICHGGWIAISAGVYRGVRVTGSPGIKDDLMNAGAIWEDTPVVVDRHFVSSRKPGDLPAFMAAIVDLLAGVAV
jgi:protease I